MLLPFQKESSNSDKIPNVLFHTNQHQATHFHTKNASLCIQIVINTKKHSRVHPTGLKMNKRVRILPSLVQELGPWGLGMISTILRTFIVKSKPHQSLILQ